MAMEHRDMRLLPNHWVGVNPKRKLPTHPLPSATGPACNSCRLRAVDDHRSVLDGVVSFSETVYCSLHGWEFATAELEEQFTCKDHAYP